MNALKDLAAIDKALTMVQLDFGPQLNPMGRQIIEEAYISMANLKALLSSLPTDSASEAYRRSIEMAHSDAYLAVYPQSVDASKVH